MTLNELKKKEILILGFGREGIDTFKFLRKIFPEKVLGVGDRLEIKNLKSKIKNLIKRDKKNRLHLGPNYLKALKNYDIIIKSPGIPIHLPEVEKAFKESKITSQTEIFFENCPGKIVGITGTKGKSTTTTLIYKILKGRGIGAHLVGNIGKPVLSLLSSAKSDDIYVYELSSHQLLTLKKSPQVAVFLNVYPEHLDYYRNFREYVNAKANITRYQTKKDFLVYNSGDKIVKEIAKKSRAKKIPIKGEYYYLDKEAAKAVGKIFEIPEKKVIKTIKSFKPLPHRLEFVGKYKDIKFYNDSLATVPEATIAAVEAFGKEIGIIILGGFDRGQNFKNLARKILENKIGTVILFPTTGERIWQEILSSRKRFSRNYRLPKRLFVNNMRGAVELAYQYTKPGKICLMSPASASFNLFKDYRERGNLFKKLVKEFARK